MRTTIFLGFVAWLAAPAAWAHTTVVIDAAAGPTFLPNSRSSAIGHAFKPGGRLGLRTPVLARLEIGGALVGLLDRSEHYRVLGVLAHGRFALWQRPRFSLGAGLAVGAGHDADILHEDRTADGAVLPYGFFALDARWCLRRHWLLGAEAAWENLSPVRLGLLIGFRWE